MRFLNIKQSPSIFHMKLINYPGIIKDIHKTIGVVWDQTQDKGTLKKVINILFEQKFRLKSLEYIYIKQVNISSKKTTTVTLPFDREGGGQKHK